MSCSTTERNAFHFLVNASIVAAANVTKCAIRGNFGYENAWKPDAATSSIPPSRLNFQKSYFVKALI